MRLALEQLTALKKILLTEVLYHIMAKKSSVSGENRDNRARVWTFVIYPESAPENWRDLLDEFHIQWAHSPLHDKDVNATGEPKKAHFHVAVTFEGKKSYEQVKEITDALHAPIPQRAHDLHALIRYFAHLDNPEKAQYSVDDIKGFGGIDIEECLRPSGSARYSLIGDMIAYIKDHHIVEYQDLMDYALANEPEWFKLLCDSASYVVDRYIKSQRLRSVCPRSDVLQVDPKTGEVLGGDVGEV